jgi:hypothetical protein
MTASPVQLLVELHGPDAGLGRSLSSIDSLIALGSRTASDAGRVIRLVRLQTSPLSDSTRCDRWINPIQTP